jgi:flagellar biogenesis protein FliO
MVASAKYGRGGRRNLEILESMGVGPQSFVHVLRVGGQYMLIGVTRGQVNLLSELDESRLVLPEVGQRVTFESILSSFRRKDNKPEDPRDNGSDNNP